MRVWTVLLLVVGLGACTGDRERAEVPVELGPDGSTGMPMAAEPEWQPVVLNVPTAFPEDLFAEHWEEPVAAVEPAATTAAAGEVCGPVPDGYEGPAVSRETVVRQRAVTTGDTWWDLRSETGNTFTLLAQLNGLSLQRIEAGVLMVQETEAIWYVEDPRAETVFCDAEAAGGAGGAELVE